MNTQASIALVGAAAMAVLLGCSNPKPMAPVAASPAAPAFTDLEIFEMPNMAPWPEVSGRVCQLGTSCLSMDPRPFEFCLLSTKDCRDKATEPLLVGQPLTIVPPLIIKTTR